MCSCCLLKLSLYNECLSHFKLQDITGLKFPSRKVEILSVCREVSRRLQILHGVRTGSSLGQSVEGDVLHPVEMDEGGRDHEDVKYLVGLEPEVTFSRQEPLANYLEIKFLSHVSLILSTYLRNSTSVQDSTWNGNMRRLTS